MKKFKFIIISLIAMFAVCGNSFAVMINTPTKVGIVKRQDGTAQQESVVVYKLVRYPTFNATNTAPSLVSGDAVVYDTVSADGISVRTTTTSADGAFAGIVMATILSPDGVAGSTAESDAGRRNWGYIAVNGGPVYANITAGGANVPAIGDVVITSTDAGKVSTSAFNTTTVSMSAVEVNRLVRGAGGFFYEAPASGSATTIKVYLKNE